MRMALVALVALGALTVGAAAGIGIDRTWLRPSGPAVSPYLAQQESPVRGLAAQEVDDLLNGRGAGFARTAELNSYPGPRHVLDMRGQLGLTAGQAAETQRIFDAMQNAAKRLGREIVDRETAFSAAFAGRRMTPDQVQTEALAMAALYGRLRATHLAAHLELTALLTPAQIAKYDAMRGYGGAGEHRHEGAD
jgi:Spy/CpxP family protein refolding chaperone